MQLVSQIIPTLVGVLLFVFLATPSFGSDIIQQDDETQQQPSTKHPFIMASSEEQLPHDVRVYILSFLPQQKDLLRMGTVSKSWRQAAAKVWEKRWLDLSNKHLTEADYKSLTGGIFLCLKLNKVGLDEKGMNILATCSHLQALELRCNNLDATVSLIKLLSLAHLSHINLYSNMIGDEGANAIAGALSHNTALITVYLGYNRIGAEGAKAIARALSQNRMLTTVNLNNNRIQDEGAEAIARVLTQNRTLTTLDLCNNWMDADGAKAIARALSQNRILTTVNLGLNAIGDEGRRALEEIKRNRPSLHIDY